MLAISPKTEIGNNPCSGNSDFTNKERSTVKLDHEWLEKKAEEVRRVKDKLRAARRQCPIDTESSLVKAQHPLQFDDVKSKVQSPKSKNNLETRSQSPGSENRPQWCVPLRTACIADMVTEKELQFRKLQKLKKDSTKSEPKKEESRKRMPSQSSAQAWWERADNCSVPRINLKPAPLALKGLESIEFWKRLRRILSECENSKQGNNLDLLDLDEFRRLVQPIVPSEISIKDDVVRILFHDLCASNVGVKRVFRISDAVAQIDLKLRSPTDSRIGSTAQVPHQAASSTPPLKAWVQQRKAQAAAPSDSNANPNPWTPHVLEWGSPSARPLVSGPGPQRPPSRTGDELRQCAASAGEHVEDGKEDVQHIGRDEHSQEAALGVSLESPRPLVPLTDEQLQQARDSSAQIEVDALGPWAQGDGAVLAAARALKAGDLGGAKRQCDDLLRRGVGGPRSLIAFYLRAEAFRRADRPAAAADDFAFCLALDPNCTAAHRGRAACFLAMRRPLSAAVHLREALRAGGAHAPTEVALELCRNVLKTSPVENAVE